MADVPDTIAALIERFGRNVDAYRAGRYNETQIRREFIDPLFTALGWDVANRAGYAEAYKDVIHEDTIKVGGATKAPDYCFRIGGARKFFVEAKKPSVDIARDVHPAYQLRRYAWSAKLPLSILTDFEEFAVYDCRIRPKEADRASVARTIYLKYTDYPTKWPQIASIFAKDAVLQGSFDTYVTGRRKRGTAEVDAEFLKEIEAWRETLARNIALRNPALGVRDINSAVQRTIDRIIFLRMAEDRGVEHYGTLQALINGRDLYPRLMQMFRSADDRYNSGLFHFNDEPGRDQPPDTLTPGLNIDDKVLKDIFRALYYPQSAYEFSVLPADILGNVYEQFLGKVIHLTKGHQARVEEKPEVKKAGGVYYTPKYIVDYIVKHTLGRLLEKSKTPQQIGGLTRAFKPSKSGKSRPLRILDPACGSGSFLVGAYRFLLAYHRDWYLADGPEKHTERIHRGAGGQWYLTTAEKKRILLSNIYGVDIDSQAVEVTKLNLLLCVLENENQGTIGQMALIHERVLPDLSRNIKCGNSLIGPDFYESKQLSLFDEEARYRINAFDWPAEFPEILGRHAGPNPGFDAVIGNPPYGASLTREDDAYFREHYKAACGTCDTFALFIEKSAPLLSSGGLFGMIVQSAWVSSPTFAPLRKLFVSTFRPLCFASMPYDVFGAYVDTVITVAKRLKQGQSLEDLGEAQTALVVFPPRHKIASVEDFKLFGKTANAIGWLEGQEKEFLVTLSDIEATIIRKAQFTGALFSDVMDIQRGVTPFAPVEDEPEINSRRAFTGTVRRYKMLPGEDRYIRYDETLTEFKPARYFEGPRLLLRELISRQFQLQAVHAEADFVTNKSMQSLLLTDPRYQILYCLGILNSKLMSWYFLAIHSVGRRDDFPKIVLKQTRSLPFPALDFTDPTDKAAHDRMVELVERMLQLHKDLAAARTDHDKTLLHRQIATTDKEIDKLVYELYGLTEEEIRIVEEATQ